VIHYTDIDQRPEYERLKPDLVVQGDDWLHSADRTEAIAYFRATRMLPTSRLRAMGTQAFTGRFLMRLPFCDSTFA
jgi:hypothetical protein